MCVFNSDAWRGPATQQLTKPASLIVMHAASPADPPHPNLTPSAQTPSSLPRRSQTVPELTRRFSRKMRAACEDGADAANASREAQLDLTVFKKRLVCLRGSQAGGALGLAAGLLPLL